MPGDENYPHAFEFEKEDNRVRKAASRDRSGPEFEQARAHNERAKKLYETN